MKFCLSVLLFVVISGPAFAECPTTLDIPMHVDSSEEKWGENHAPLRRISLTLPVSFDSYSVFSLELTFGDVVEFAVPLAFEIKDEEVFATFAVSEHYLNSLELTYEYRAGDCQIVVSRLVRF